MAHEHKRQSGPEGGHHCVHVRNMPAVAIDITAVATQPISLNVLEMRVNWPKTFCCDTSAS